MPNGFDETRFRELVLYIAWKTRDDPKFGRTKLAKTLFYSDFTAYAEEGKALTGARYQHWQFGPSPPVLFDVQDYLVRQGVAELRPSEFAGDEERLVATKRPTTPHLQDWELRFVDRRIAEIAADASWRVSDRSHEHPAWIATTDREEIPYEAALISMEPPSERVRDLARKRFADLGYIDER